MSASPVQDRLRRVLHLLRHSQMGNGNVHLAVDLACAQATAGHEVIFASARGAFDGLLRTHGVEVVELPEAVDALGALRHQGELLRLLRRRRPAIVHAHMASSAVLALPLVRLTGARLVTTVHNSFDRQSNLMRLGDAIVAVSEAERRTLLARRYPRRRLHTVLNGVLGSPRESLPNARAAHLDQPCVVTLSGLHGRKGLPDAITAFSLVAGDFPEWHLNLVGGGPDKSLLQAHVASLGLEGRVRFVGYAQAPRYLLEQAAIFVSASTAEPFGLSTAEARAAGCAIVATAVGGVPEVVEHGRAGRLVPPSDPAAMAAALRRLMADPEELRTWRTRAAEGLEWLSTDRMSQDYDAVYDHVLGRTRANT